MKKRLTAAVILAAGKGTRITAVSNKQTAEIGGKSVIERTLSAFEEAETVDEIIFVAGIDTEKLLQTLPIKKPTKIVSGGNCREESALNGVRAASPDAEFVAIHDGARPFITAGEIDEAIRLAYKYGAVCCGTRPKDTVKQTDENGFVTHTPKRSSLFAAATPQIFRKDDILSAMEKEEENLAEFTDDCSVAEKHGIQIKTFLCSYENIKITTNEDLHLAALILAGRE